MGRVGAKLPVGRFGGLLNRMHWGRCRLRSDSGGIALGFWGRFRKLPVGQFRVPLLGYIGAGWDPEGYFCDECLGQGEGRGRGVEAQRPAFVFWGSL